MAQRARPSRGTSGRSATRKPVTIDLEAEKIEQAASDADAHEPEPVALDAGKDAEPARQDNGSDAEEPDIEAAPRNGGSDANTADGATDEPERPATPPPTPPPSRSGTGAVTGGLIGGLAALVGAAGLQWAGVLPSLAPQPEPAPVVDLAPVETRVSDLESQLAALAEAEPAPAELPPAVTERIAAVESGAEQAQSLAAAAQSALEDIAGQVDQLSAAISAGEAGENAGLEALTGRLGALEEEIGALAQSVGEAPGGEALAQLAADAAAALATSQTVRSALEGATGRIDEVEQAVGTFRSSVDETLASIGERLQQAEATIAEGGADSTIVARAIAAAGLKSAIDRGSAFMTELEAYASIAGEDEAVARLRDFAATGVPTVSQLADQFDGVAGRIVAAGQGLDPDASIADRLMSSARGLVQVRPVGDAVGDTPGAIAARMEARLNAGELDAALAQWEQLPDAAKQASAAFVDRLRARQTVDDLVAGALESAMAAARPAAETTQ